MWMTFCVDDIFQTSRRLANEIHVFSDAEGLLIGLNKFANIKLYLRVEYQKIIENATIT